MTGLPPIANRWKEKAANRTAPVEYGVGLVRWFGGRVRGRAQLFQKRFSQAFAQTVRCSFFLHAPLSLCSSWLWAMVC